MLKEKDSTQGQLLGAWTILFEAEVFEVQLANGETIERHGNGLCAKKSDEQVKGC